MTIPLAPLVLLAVGTSATVAAADCSGLQLVKELGFPAAVVAFLLVRLEPRIAKLTDALHALAVEMAETRGMRRRATDRE